MTLKEQIPDLSDLISRVEGAREPSREIDARLSHAFDNHRYAFTGDPVPLSEVGGLAPAYTSSLDVVVALAERLGFYINTQPRFHIDGERVDFVSHALRPRWADWRPDDEWFDRGDGRHSNQTLSALLALLTALQEGIGN